MRVRNVCSAALLWSAAILSSGCKGTEPSVATTVVVIPGSANFVTLNATQALTAKVLDQRGDSMPGQAIAWSATNAAVATVSTTGVVTAKGNGTTTIVATAGGASAPITVTVAQAASAINKTGDAQTGTVGAALATLLSVHVQDAGGSAIAGAAVAFSVASGGGSLVGAATTTNATGDATAGWTLGTVAGSVQGVSVTSGTAATSFSATANAGAASAITPQAGNNQTRVTGLPMVVAPSVKVADAFGNPKQNVTVVFAVASGGGSVTGATKVTDALGVATVGSWTMGAAAGTNTLSATVQGTAIAFTFTATATSAGAPTTMAVVAATNNQTALKGYRTNFRPAVLVTDAGGQPVAGVSVTFAVATGGGSLTTPTVNTNAFGIAQVGGWTVGGAAGANSVTATAAPGGIAGNPVTIAATAADPLFNIVIRNIGPTFSAQVQTAFDSAAVYWQRILYNDLSDITFTNTSVCGGAATLSETVDDLLILAKFDSIDGPNNILANAGACSIRNSNALSIVGLMNFDTADVRGLINNGSLNSVILHEMGHVLGFSSGLWNISTPAPFTRACAQNLSSAGNALDTYFSCPLTQAAFDSIGGTTYTGGNKAPLENCGAGTLALPGISSCGSGTINSHWREPVFGNELMTGYLNAGTNPLSLLTIAVYGDMGYSVNFAVAQTYTRVFMAPTAAGGARIEMVDDVLRIPVHVVDDRSGRVTRVIRP